jgi:polysaccharide export outer membrane protein
LFILVPVLVVGCESARKSTPNAAEIFQRATPHVIGSREYRVDPPDEIVVKAPNIKELDGQKQKVRPDGKISLNLLGEVTVTGLTPLEINELLSKLAAKYYTNPDIKVEVIANSKFYYVFGFGVAKQGRYAFTGRDTVITALAEAGFTEQAWPQQVRVSRPARKSQAKNATAVVDFKHIYSYGDLTRDFVLEEGDIIEIPYSPLAAWDVKSRQLFGPITGAAGMAGSATSVVHPGGTSTGH